MFTESRPTKSLPQTEIHDRLCPWGNQAYSDLGGEL